MALQPASPDLKLSHKTDGLFELSDSSSVLALSDAPGKPFRFCDLPQELRDEIYKLLLCSFEPPLPKWSDISGDFQPCNHNIRHAQHSVDTTILRTCKTIYTEAYGIMAKTNQFIKLYMSTYGRTGLLLPSQVPLISIPLYHTDHFQGYVMTVYIRDKRRTGPPDFNPPVEDDNMDPDLYHPNYAFMILGSDWPEFCNMLSQTHRYMHRTSFSAGNQISIFFPDRCGMQIPPHKANIDSCFFKLVQEVMLKPFHHLRGWAKVEIEGAIDSKLAEVVVEEVTRPVCTDTSKVIDTLKVYKESGNNLFRDGDAGAALQKYSEGFLYARLIRHGTSWSHLLRDATTPWLNEFAELHFAILLNCTQAYIKIMLTLTDDHERAVQCGIINSSLNEAIQVPQDLAQYGASWVPSNLHLAKIYYRQAHSLRLVPDNHNIDRALACIERALVIHPGHAIIAQEREKIMQWRQQVDSDMA